MTHAHWSAALTGSRHGELRDHLLRPDGQEDVCVATYRLSTGRQRRTALVRDTVMPREGERLVHGTASFTTPYVLRAAQQAAADGCGVVALHSHPLGRGWQSMSPVDRETEAGYANLARDITGYPLIGMTLGGDEGWSARAWDHGTGRDIAAADCENTRVIHSDRLVTSWNNELRPAPPTQTAQMRTAHCWGDIAQANIARLRVLVVGTGSVGILVATALAATGLERVAVMDYDTVKNVNLDRLLGATPLDAYLARSKAELCRRIVNDAATAARPQHDAWEHSVCEPTGFSNVLDFDVIFSCVDRPWPRYVLNTVAYSDLIPVIDGGIHIDPFRDGGMRGAIWRSHVVGPGRVCLACNGQYHPSHIALERDGSLEDPTYIAGLAVDHPLRVRQNVSVLSINCAGALLAQFVSLVVTPGGLGDPGSLRYQLAPHLLQRDMATTCIVGCPYPATIAAGDLRLDPTGRHDEAESERRHRARRQKRPGVRAGRAADDLLLWLHTRLNQGARHRLSAADHASSTHVSKS